MISHTRNHAASRAACPVLTDGEISAYIERDEVPDDAPYVEVPPGVIVRKTGFWFRPKERLHSDATLFLISLDGAAVSADAERNTTYVASCYRLLNQETYYLGLTEGQCLQPLMEHQFPSLPLAKLRFIGKVIAAK